MFKVKHECKEAFSTYAPCISYPGKPTCPKKQGTIKKHTRMLTSCSQSVNFMDSTFSLVSNSQVMKSYEFHQKKISP